MANHRARETGKQSIIGSLLSESAVKPMSKCPTSSTSNFIHHPQVSKVYAAASYRGLWVNLHLVFLRSNLLEYKITHLPWKRGAFRIRLWVCHVMDVSANLFQPIFLMQSADVPLQVLGLEKKLLWVH